LFIRPKPIRRILIDPIIAAPLPLGAVTKIITMTTTTTMIVVVVVVEVGVDTLHGHLHPIQCIGTDLVLIMVINL